MTEMKDYKWLVSSCLQKSIRRGNAILAQSYVNFLWEHDRSYLTYRLGTVLAEDVGIANTPLLTKYLSTKVAKKAIDEKGGKDFISEIVQEACESIKDRSACDAAYFASFTNFNQSKDNLVDIIKSSQDYEQSIKALWIVLGNKRFKSENIEFLDNYPLNEKGEKTDNVSEVLNILKDLSLSKEIIDIFHNAYLTQRENIALGLPIMKVFQDKEKDLPKVGSVIEKIICPEFSVLHPDTGLNFINIGLDGHTQEGRRIYFKYLESNNDFSNYLNDFNINKDLHFDILKHCMFRLEGHEVNKRIYYPTAVKVMQDCEQKVLDLKANNSRSDFKFLDLKQILLKDLDYFNVSRKQLFQSKSFKLNYK